MDLDFSPLVEIFRERTLKMLLARGRIAPGRVALVRSWRHSGFAVHWERRVEASDRRGLESLLEYMERPAVALDRLTYREDGLVHYRGSFHLGLGRDHQLVTGLEFLALLVPHIQLKHEVIRSYGALSTTIRRRLGWTRKAPEGSTAPPSVAVVDGEESEFVRECRRNWARLIQKVWLEDPSLCARCGKEMKSARERCADRRGSTGRRSR